MNYYRLKNKDMPWGDYGQTLFAGCCFFNRKTGKYTVLRTAPFVPSICRAYPEGLLLVTEVMKQLLAESGLRGLTFQLAVKERIVSLAWENWDLTAPEPKIYPSGDMDAEEYITRRKHNEQLAEEMGNIWVVISASEGYEIRGQKPASLVAQSIGNADIFIPTFGNKFPQISIYVSEKAKDWLVQYGNGDVCFEPVEVKELSEQELKTLQNEVEQERLRQEKENAMTKDDWKKWHKLTREAEKLAKERHSSKSEKTKNRRITNAIAKFNEAEELYPIRPYEELINELQKEQSDINNASIH